MATFLLAYSSVDGQTRRIMNVLAEELVRADHQIRYVDIESGELPLWQGIDQVVVGAAVRYGDHRPALYRFVERHQGELAKRPSAFFSVNLTARKPNRNTPDNSRYMQKFREKSPWRPDRLAVFPGALQWDRYGLFDKTMIRFIMWLTKGPTDTGKDVDFTDWQQVRDFARTLAGQA
ncbi:menaquinone-dependent protoporphyrinogen IX dehydrogenase [Gallaecimonas sp. GXIMD4217]|uniref:menaquinone-dependent protoporphyrinogen IX dehydrogenase n=1 Tax=Gallaecimonas sp. GXIMD4217 TaxID=3131927 RepID=UPI00311ABB8B